MATSVTPAQIRDTEKGRVPAAVELSSVVSRVAAVLAGARGVIHLAIVRHHRDYAVIAAAFALMGVVQFLVAAGLFTRSSPRVRLAGSLLHAWIVATWLLSGTVGLVVVPGAEERGLVGMGCFRRRVHPADLASRPGALRSIGRH